MTERRGCTFVALAVGSTTRLRPPCGTEPPPVQDTRERTWRHLNFFQYPAYIHAKVPRVCCARCAKTTQVAVPWARPNSGFSQLMEALIVTLGQVMAVRQVALPLGVSDQRIWRTLDYYVAQARTQEDYSGATTVGLDETAARCGQPYMSLCHDLQRPRLLFACEGRKAEVVRPFADDLEAHGACADNIQDVGIDMSSSYRAGVQEHLPLATITFDEFHVVQRFNTAVDEVHRAEVKQVPELKCSRS